MDGGTGRALEIGKVREPNCVENDEDLVLRRHARDSDATIAMLRGRSDLFYLALDQRMLIMRNAVANERSARTRISLIESVMDEETRYRLWQHLAE